MDKKPNQTTTTTNPFKLGNPEEVWKELLKNSKRITREEFNQKMKEAIELQKELRAKS
jgi:hypothetical protein